MPSKAMIGKSLSNAFVRDGKALVSKIEVAGNAKAAILKAVDSIGGFSEVIDEGDRILVKPNFNSADTPPASTEPGFLRAIVELLFLGQYRLHHSTRLL